jgi:tetratricopeptide (TPR) repeat protein
MAIIPLRVYNHEIEGMIDNSQLDEAVAHCRHILATFPKHIATYRLLGKAHLEQQRISDATDIFQRVLSSVPDDFIANVGMSIIREDENNLDASIWHMELAYEAQPSNAAIQDELRRLYGRRDGVQPPKVRLTRGALSRMYAKGGLYDQAIAELRAAMTEEPNRPDLQILLAEMYFQTNQRVEAVETCANILKKIPLCLEANRILAVSLPEAEGSEAIKNYRQIVISLDPYYAFAGPESISSDQVPENAVNIERLDYKSGIQVSEAPIQPNWATSLGISIDKPADDNVPDWLKAAEAAPQPSPTGEQGNSSVSPFIWDTQEVTNIINESSKSQTEIPDWMKDAGWQPSSGEETPPPVKETPVQPTQESPVSGEPEKAEIPDWLQGIAPIVAGSEEKPAAETSESNLSTPWLEQHQPGPSDSIIHWLEDNKHDTPPDQPTREEAAAPLSEDEMPDWLKDLEPTEASTASPQETKPTTPAFTIEPDAFIEETPNLESPETPVTPFDVPIEVAPGAAEETPPTQIGEALPGMPAPAEAQAESAEEIPDWLKELAEEPSASEESMAIEESAPVEEPTSAESQAPTMEFPESSAMVSEEGLEKAAPILAEMITPEEIPAVPGEVPTMTEQESKEEAPLSETPAVSEELFTEENKQGLEEVLPESEVKPISEELPLVEMPLPAESSTQPEAPVFAEELPALEQPAQTDQELSIEPSKLAEEPALTETPGVVEAELPVEGKKPAEELNALAWLEDIAAEQSTKLESLPTTPEGGEILPPEWVKLDAEPPLDEFTTQERKPADATAVPAEEIPDWIKGLGEEPEAQPVAEEPLPVPEIEMTPSEELPAWLQELEQPESEKGEAAPSEEALEWKAEEMPDWLKEISETQPSTSQPAPIETSAPVESAEEAVPATMEPSAVVIPSSEEPMRMEIPTATEAAPAEMAETFEAPLAAETTPAEVAEELETPVAAEVAPEAVTEPVKPLASEEVAPMEIPETLEAPVAGEVAPEEVAVTPEAPAAEEVAPMEIPETLEAPVAGEVAPEEVAVIPEAPTAVEVAPMEIPETLEAPAAVEAAPEEVAVIPEAPTAVEVAPMEIPETLEVPAAVEAAPEEVAVIPEAPAFEEVPPVEVPETLDASVAAEAVPMEVPETLEAPVTAEVPPVEVPETLEAPVAAEVPPVEVPETLETPAEKEIPPVILQPAPEWASELTPPAGIKRSALEETSLEPVIPVPAAEEIIQPAATVPTGAIEPVLEEVTPVFAEAPVSAEEVSLEAFKAASAANQAALFEARNSVNQGQPSQAIEFYQGLIKQNYHLDEIIKDLQEALYRFPVNIDMWVTLGNAHLRAEDLTEALSAYTKAEELVR